MAFKTKIVLTITLLMAGLLSAMAAFHFHFSQKEMVESISERQFTLVSALSQNIDHKISSAQEQLSALASLVSVEILENEAEGRSFLQKQRALQHLFDGGLFLMSSRGHFLAIQADSFNRENLNAFIEQSCKKTVETKKNQISDPISSPDGIEPVILFTAPVIRASGEVLGVLGGSVNLLQNNFLGHLADIQLGEGGYLYLYNQNRTMIVHPDRSRIMQQDVPPGVNRMYDKALGGFEGTGETVNSRGLHAFSSFKRLQTTDWILAANFPVSEAFSSIADAKRYFIYGLSATLLFTSLLVWLLLRHFMKPLEALSTRIRSFGGDRVPEPLHVQSQDEIGELARAFNQMTERLSVKDKVLKSQLQFLQIMIDAMPQPVYYKDTSGRYIGCNKAFENVLGAPRDEILGKRVNDFFEKNLADAYFQSDYELLARGLGHTQVYENPVLYADQSWREVIFYKATFPAEDGLLGGIVGTIIDISNRKKAEKDLQKLSLAVHQNPAAVIITDREGTIEYVNPKFTQISGFSLEEAMGQKPGILLSGTISTEEEVWCTLQEGREWQGEFQNRRKDGTFYWSRASISPVRDETGCTNHYVAVLEDVTEWKATQEALEKAKERAEGASRAKNQFLANMSHEIRTPLNGVLGMLELLQGTGLDEEQRDYATIAADSGRSLLRVISDILDFSRIEAGSLELVEQSFDLLQTVDHVVRVFEHETRQRPLQIRVDVKEEVPRHLEGDEGRLRQILFNLIGNAVKFTGEGEIVIDISAKVNAKEEKVTVQFGVRDTGIGIPEEALGHIFEAFTQVDGSLKRRYEGTGLGLSIVKRLIDLLGGDLTVESTIGAGTIFYFQIPFRLSHLRSQTSEQQQKTRPLNQQARILLVEDNLVNQFAAKKMLEKLGHSVQLAEDGQKALDRLAEESFDLVLLDIQMPVMDGWEVTRAVRERKINVDPDLPIIAITAHAMKGDREAMISAGMNDYIAKPISLKKLRQILEAHLPERREGEENVPISATN